MLLVFVLLSRLNIMPDMRLLYEQRTSALQSTPLHLMQMSLGEKNVHPAWDSNPGPSEYCTMTALPIEQSSPL
jgi:hypothetical protein